MAAVTLTRRPSGFWVPPSANGASGGWRGDDRGEGRAMEEREARSEKVTLADPIRVCHLLRPLRVREVTQAEPSLQYHMNTALCDSC